MMKIVWVRGENCREDNNNEFDYCRQRAMHGFSNGDEFETVEKTIEIGKEGIKSEKIKDVIL